MFLLGPGVTTGQMNVKCLTKYDPGDGRAPGPLIRRGGGHGEMFRLTSLTKTFSQDSGVVTGVTRPRLLSLLVYGATLHAKRSVR